VSVLLSSKKEMEDVDGRIRVRSGRIYSTELGPSGEMVSGVQIRSVGLEDGVSRALGNRWSTTCPLSRPTSERVGTHSVKFRANSHQRITSSTSHESPMLSMVIP
jgi:hypothetical protein